MKHRFERIIAKSENVARKAEVELEELRGIGPAHREKLLEEQIEMTEFHKETIRSVFKYTSSLFKRLGIERKPVEPRIVIVKSGSTNELEGGKKSGGYSNAMRDYIVVDDSKSMACFASALAHEYFHNQGYLAAQVVDEKEEEGVHMYRSGISLHDRSDPEAAYFKDIEEAIVSELANEYLQQVAGENVEVADELVCTQAIVDWVEANEEFRDHISPEVHDRAVSFLAQLKVIPDAARILNLLLDETFDTSYKIGYLKAHLESFDLNDFSNERLRERKHFDSLIEEVVVASGEKFSYYEIYSDFIKAHFSGNYFPLARKIEAALGKGSFRRIGEDFGNKKVKERSKRG